MRSKELNWVIEALGEGGMVAQEPGLGEVHQSPEILQGVLNLDAVCTHVCLMLVNSIAGTLAAA